MLTNQKSVLIWLNTLFGNHQTGTMPSCLPKVTWGLFFSFFWGLFACFARLLLLSRLDLWTRCVAAFRQSVLRLAAALSSLSRHVLSCVWRRRRGGGERRRNTEPDGNHTPPHFPWTHRHSHSPSQPFHYLQECVLPPRWGCWFTSKWSLNHWNVDDSWQVGLCLSFGEVEPVAAMAGLADPERRSCDV